MPAVIAGEGVGMPDKYGLLTEAENQQIEKDIRELSQLINVVYTEKAKELILDAMRSLVKNDGGNVDTVWITKTESVFDRFGSIYFALGGTYDELRRESPEYF